MPLHKSAFVRVPGTRIEGIDICFFYVCRSKGYERVKFHLKLKLRVQNWQINGRKIFF